MSETSIQNEPASEEMPGISIARNRKQRRNLAAFWLLGLCNSFAYVVMLSAAHDILKEEEGGDNNGTSAANFTTTTLPLTTSSGQDVEYLSCNTISTGAILLADILPTLIIKLTAPFYIQRIPYWIKTTLVIMFAASSFLIVAFAHEVWLSILGVVCASCSGGIGGITFLSLSTFYNRNVISTWSSGTGGAGVFGSLVYTALTSIGISARNTVLTLLCIPVLMGVSYFVILTEPEKPVKSLESSASESTLLLKEESTKISLSTKQKLKLVLPLLKYMAPLSVVYFAEYFINQGLHELLYYNHIWLNKSEQYRWYQVDYQIGVFISRSSVNLLHIKRLWILPILQLVNMSVLLSQVFYRFIPNIWIIFIIVLWEGLLGGAAYVNTFYKMSNEVVAEHREFSLGMATLGDSVGIAVAGAVAIPSHNHICTLTIKL